MSKKSLIVFLLISLGSLVSQVYQFSLLPIVSEAEAKLLKHEALIGENYKTKDFPLQGGANLVNLEHSPEYLICTGKNPKYTRAMNELEQAIKEVAIQRQKSHQIMEKMTHRLWELIEFAGHQLPSHPSKSNSDEILKKYFGDNRNDIYRDSRLGCDEYNGGCVGNDPQVLKEALLHGNLREKNKMLWRDAFNFLNDISDFACHSAANGKGKAETLSFRESFMDYCENMEFLERGKFTAFAKEYKINNDDKTLQQIVAGLAPTYDQMRIPLSSREMAYLKRYPQDAARYSLSGKISSDKIYYNMGVAVSTKKEDGEVFDPLDPWRLYHRTANLLGFRTLVSPSGSTDQILSLALILGIQEKEDLEALRIAMIGLLVEGNHHSVYEVLVGALSFPQISVEFGPKYYQTLTSDPQFSQEVEKAYFKRNPQGKLPEEVMKDCMEEQTPDSGICQ